MNERRIERRSLGERQKAADWSKADRLTDEEITARVEADPDAPSIIDATWLSGARRVCPPEKIPVSLRLDRDVLEHFKEAGPRYQTRINAVLRAFVEHERRERR